MASREDIRAFLNQEAACVLVEVAVAAGSTPRDTDAWMLVSKDRTFATIGGGQLEYMAIDHARKLLQGASVDQTLTIPLGPEIGQCCGGRVALAFEPVDKETRAALIERSESEIARRPHVYVFGAGHVGDALALALSLVPLRTILVDTREQELSAVDVPGIETCLTAMPEAVVRDAPAGSAFVILTHDHALDFLIAAEALGREDACYVGMIGSKTKRATFKSWLSREIERPELLERLVCPIGGTTVKDKRPAVIAALAAAEIMTAALNHDHPKDGLPSRKRGKPVRA
ncbi:MULTISPECIES: xanthine dehydrogenase accessory protein XdhC [unclassified Sinorhizobium]|uniref:xanthine dehydrogenase accessory protein XdhC n=1 Tax=unclassified Sinorhizobium TaxID=2613772 RepID=UPI0024C2E020|nr:MULTISPECIES: xanthine dehydrogenase accessory protein XdhC [unclassified Sinorhizobium]MDK1373971.1 xanthine dehydrogenase accessory protein XdhC [Sinorhizobium sp. 6-70]MDK1477384.1 xanthine dehydrogenase accessory protein XdhC [Sinorhizobium sp. 6-117]